MAFRGMAGPLVLSSGCWVHDGFQKLSGLSDAPALPARCRCRAATDHAHLVMLPIWNGDLSSKTRICAVRGVSQNNSRKFRAFGSKKRGVGLALAKEVERNVRRRREEVGSTAGELAAPQELKDMAIPRDSDPRKRRVMKAATAAASSGSSQMEDSRGVAEAPTQQNSTTDESRMDAEGEERRIQKFESAEHQTTICDENIIGGEQK